MLSPSQCSHDADRLGCHTGARRFGRAAPPKGGGLGPNLQAQLGGLVDAIGYNSGERSIYKPEDTEVPGEIIVRLKNRLDTAAVQKWAARYGAQLMSSIDLLNVHQLKVDDAAAAAKVRAAIQADPNVVYATPNRIARIAQESHGPAPAISQVITPNDPYRSQQYALAKERAYEAWDVSRGAPQAIVVVIDTGIDYNHEEFRTPVNKYVFGYDFVNNDDDAMDDHNHGTHVAGKAAAWTNNGVGIAGLAWYSPLMAAKVLDSTGRGTTFNTAKGIFLAALIQQAIRDYGFRVVANMSLEDDWDPTVRLVVWYSYYIAGVLMIAVSGNTLPAGRYIARYPAAYEEVISVACTDQNDSRCSYSNYHETVELSAPGDQIWSTIRVISGTYGYDSGTSMSAPDVTGIAALVWARWPSKTNAQVRTCLNLGVDDLEPLGRDMYYGFGRINALKAVQCDLVGADNWPMINRDPAHTGYAPGQPPPSFPLSLAWTYQAAQLPSPVVVSGSVAYFGSCLTLEPLPACRFYSVDARTGSLRWSQPMGRGAGPGAVAGDIVYTNAGDSKIYAFDVATGAIRWTFQKDGGPTFSGPTVVDGVVYTGGGEAAAGPGAVYALDAATGALTWRYNVPSNSTGTPAVVDGAVYVGDDNGKVHAIDAATGTARWTFQTGWHIRSVPAVANSTLYVGSMDGKVYALNTSNGIPRWIFQAERPVVGAAAVAEGLVYFGDGNAPPGKLYAVDANSGALRWSSAFSAQIWASPAVAGGVVFVQVLDGNIYALDAATGARRWSYAAGTSASAMPAIASGMLFVASGLPDNKVYAFRLR